MRPAYREFAPNASLAPYIECYWHLGVTSGQPQHQVLPDGCVDLLFSRQKSESLGLAVIGLMTTFIAPLLEPGQSFFGVRWKPGMASAFIPDASNLTDRVEPLDSFWGSKAIVLLNDLADCRSAESMVRRVERDLRPIISPETLDDIVGPICRGTVSLHSAAAVNGISMRTLRRKCKVRTGVTPKLLSRILRFRRAADRIRALKSEQAEPGWAEFARICGFFDQAHLIHEFQTFSGGTPGRYLQSLRRQQRLDSGDERTQA